MYNFKKYLVFLGAKGKEMLSSSRSAKLFLTFFLLFSVLTVRARREDGLLFRSYEVVPDLRTSLQLPAHGRQISFKDSLSLSFDVKLDLARGRFGYVCRVFLDGDAPADILLSTSPEGETFLGATGDHRNIVRLPGPAEALSRWQRIRLTIIHRDGNLEAAVNDRIFYSAPDTRPRHGVSVCFGKVDSGQFGTTDVAPMVVRNLRVRTDHRKPWVWALSSEAELQEHGGPALLLGNPEWLQNYNRRWRKVWSMDMPTVTYLCPDTLRGRLWLISGNQVVRYSLDSIRADVFPVSRRIKARLATNDFVVLPDGTLAYADAEFAPEMIRFTGTDWEKDNPRTRSSIYRHHNTISLGNEGSYAYLFGYGQHRYQGRMKVWNPFTGASQVQELPGVYPRYLSSAALRDSVLYVMGGKGNEVGIQELGIKLYDDFFSVNIADGTVSRLWKSPLLQQEVGAGNLLFSADGESFMALTYDPNVFESALQLRRFSTRDGSYEDLANPIPYSFLDVDSEAVLLYNSRQENYVAAVSCKSENGEYGVSVFVLESPILPPVQLRQEAPAAQWWPLALLALVLVAGAAFAARALYRARSRRPEKARPQEPYPQERFRVRLLGGFKVLSAAGEDITATFSPQTARFFCILILYTAEQDGISNARLKNLLWSDKSDESYNNNRGVTMKKIRTILEQVGNISFVSENGRWKVSDPENLCDYLYACQALETDLSLPLLQEIAGAGPLLPEAQSDYLDSFKELYTNRVLDKLEQFRSLPDLAPDQAIGIADAVLLFDSLDEEAIRLKCQALISQKKLGSAQTVFTRFAEEFQRMMGEPYPADFKDFVKK